jgi:6,7-dimethyl-8-ribityllumazine synthase
MNDDDQLRNLYAGLAMLGYIIQGHTQSYNIIVEQSLEMADALLDRVKEQDVPYESSSNRGLAAVKPKKKKE